jgi:hypothetical protein
MSAELLTASTCVPHSHMACPAASRSFLVTPPQETWNLSLASCCSQERGGQLWAYKRCVVMSSILVALCNIGL